MKGVVFQTSAKMITNIEPQCVVSGGGSRFSHETTKPVAGSNASRHAKAATTVTAPLGTSTEARIAVRAKIARYIACAISMPSASSSVTEMIVTNTGLRNALHQVLDESTVM